MKKVFGNLSREDVFHEFERVRKYVDSSNHLSVVQNVILLEQANNRLLEHFGFKTKDSKNYNFTTSQKFLISKRLLSRYFVKKVGYKVDTPRQSHHDKDKK